MQVYSTYTVLLHTTLFDRKRFSKPTHQANRIPSNLCSTWENRKKSLCFLGSRAPFDKQGTNPFFDQTSRMKIIAY